MTSLAFWCQTGKHDRCPLHSNRCVCVCHPAKENPVHEELECPECGRMTGGAAGLASHMRSMHPDAARVEEV